MGPESVFALPRQRPSPGQTADVHDPEPAPAPYLPAIGAPPLRFQEFTPPPDLVVRPAAGAPPNPALTQAESTVALANAAAVQSTLTAPSPDAAAATKPEPKPAPAAATKPAPPPILPDDSRPAVRPEDFLPYFQIPGAATQPGDVNLLVPAPRATPAPAPLPPSSATYTQSK